MKVVDISAWQYKGYIDWQALKDYGIGGVIIKIGEKYTLDEMFCEHANNAVAYGIPFGVYYYGHAYNIDEAKREAMTVNEWIKDYLGKTPQLGIWYDAEDKSMLKSSNNVVYPIAHFVHTLRELGHNYVGVYSSYNWLTNIIDLQPLPKDVPIWVAQYNKQNDFKQEHPDRICKMWQYTDREKIGNMSLDCNIYYE